MSVSEEYHQDTLFLLFETTLDGRKEGTNMDIKYM